MNIKILIRIILEIICAFGLLYAYIFEVQQRHFLHFSNGCYMTVWNTKYLIMGKYYGLTLPRDYAEINTSSPAELYSHKDSPIVFVANILSNLIPDSKLTVSGNKTSGEKFEYRIRIDADPIPEFYIEASNQIVAMYPLFINPIVSAFISSAIPFFIVFLTVVAGYYLTNCLKFLKSSINNNNKTLRILLESTIVLIVVIGLSFWITIGNILGV